MDIITTELWRSLTRALPLAGSLDIRQHPSAAELALEAEFTEAVVDPLATTYQHPLRYGVDAVPEDEDDMRRWLLAAVGATAATAALRSALQSYLRLAFNIGGAAALASLGSSDQFNLQDAALIASINAWAASLTTTGSDISLTRTTANDLIAQITAGREAGLTADELDEVLETYISARVLARAGSVAFNETVRLARRGEIATYGRNGITAVIYRMSRGRNLLRPDECDDAEGKEFSIRDGNIIPQHVGCGCYWQPVFRGWTRPGRLWTGG